MQHKLIFFNFLLSLSCIASVAHWGSRQSIVLNGVKAKLIGFDGSFSGASGGALKNFPGLSEAKL